MECGKELGKGKHMFIARIKCKIFGHSLVFAGNCPFNGVVYDFCEICNMTIPREGYEVD